MDKINYLQNAEERKLGDWTSVSELESFQVVKTAPKYGGLLATPMADVLFTYKKKPGQKDDDVKRLHLYGEEGRVYTRAMQIIERKKNPAQRNKMLDLFIDEFNLTKFTPTEGVYGTPGSLLSGAIQSRGLTARQFAEKSGIKAPSLYHHVSGGREISREVAIEYSKKLNCDPVDLMFEKKSIPIWSKCDLLKATELEDNYKAGRLFAYSASDENLEHVVVPRDIFRSDIKAIKIEARGSMYHNKVAFYYRATDKEQNYLNQLCVVGVEVPIGPKEFTDDVEDRFYFGTYEEVRGQSNLINPDPYVQNESKFILKNFTPKFIAPIVALINPEAVVDQTKLKHSIPKESLIREEEKLKGEIDYYKKIMKQEITNRDEAMTYAKHHAEQNKKLAATIEKTQKEAEDQVRELMKKIEAVTQEIERESALKKSVNLFQKIGDSISREHRAKLRIVGDKK